MDEIWKPIPDTDYAVSNTGKVASMKKGWRVLKGVLTPKGYIYVSLYDGVKQQNVRVHKLVAEVFLGPRPTPKHQVNHIDGVKHNNHANNCEWVTPAENTRHAYTALGYRGHVGIRGEANSLAKLTEAKVREIRIRRAAGELRRVIAADYGISCPQVSDISSGKKWAHVK